ncbi:hypothetical protein AX14_001201 [Amanita brunnescens Koide BX004]|nr:hypothetical protein AX14_001201 [Amanita brunnescens Koide BX004]
MSSQTLLGLSPPTQELKPIVPFLQRAHEVRQQHPIIAYWCAYYAAQQGIAIQAKDASSRLFLFSLLDLLEKMKQEIEPIDAIDNEAAGCAYVENFALRVFSLADNEDRQGNATRATAKTFLVAASFLEVLNVFPKTEVSDSIDEKIRYAKWKAADIAKAFREGRAPVPGPAAPAAEPAVEKTLELPSSDQTNTADVHANETASQDRAPRTAWVSEELEGRSTPVPETPPVLQRPVDIDVIPAAPSFPTEVDLDWDAAATASPPQTADHHIPPFPQPPSPPPVPSASPYVPLGGGLQPLPPPVPSAPPYVPPDAGLRHPPPPVPSAPPYIPPDTGLRPPPALPVHISAPPPSVPSSPEELTPSLVVKIQRHCRFAISSLDYEDAEQAKKELRAALELLGG